VSPLCIKNKHVLLHQLCFTLSGLKYVFPHGKVNYDINYLCTCFRLAKKMPRGRRITAYEDMPGFMRGIFHQMALPSEYPTPGLIVGDLRSLYRLRLRDLTVTVTSLSFPIDEFVLICFILDYISANCRRPSISSLCEDDFETLIFVPGGGILETARRNGIRRIMRAFREYSSRFPQMNPNLMYYQ